MYIKTILSVFLLILITSCKSDESTPENGDLDQTFINNLKDSELSEDQLIEKAKLFSEGWKEKNIKNGDMLSCYNFTPKKDDIINSLKVNVGGGTDVVIKVMEVGTEKCIRYVFVGRDSSYDIKKLPESRYYLKIAYGKDWLSKIENGQCLGKFFKHSLYEKGEDIMDFNIIYNNDNSYSIPSFEISLDVISSNNFNTFNSATISEEEFNK